MQQSYAIITGASDGIGEQAARELAGRGWQVAVVGRNPQRTHKVAAEIGGKPYVADFSSLSQVAELAGALKRDFPRIDLLCNNAGGIFSRQPHTVDGHEVTFQVNHLAPFLLTNLLMETLLESRAKVIATSSVAHRLIGFMFNIQDPDMRGGYSSHLAYGNSKLCNILFTRELHRRYGKQGLCASAFHPGVVASSFAGNTHSPMRLVYGKTLSKLLGLKTSLEGADTMLWLALSEPGCEYACGGYFAQRRPAAVSPKARSERLARMLWEKSEEACEAFLRNG